MREARYKSGVKNENQAWNQPRNQETSNKSKEQIKQGLIKQVKRKERKQVRNCRCAIDILSQFSKGFGGRWNLVLLVQESTGVWDLHCRRHGIRVDFLIWVFKPWSGWNFVRRCGILAEFRFEFPVIRVAEFCIAKCTCNLRIITSGDNESMAR